MNTSIHDTKEFLALFCNAAGVPLFVPQDRACVITRSPANYRDSVSAIIEFEGSPPRFCIFNGNVLVVDGKLVKSPRIEKALPILWRYLEAHPANEDGLPVWVGSPYKDRP